MRIPDFPLITDIKQEYCRLRQEGNSRDATTELLKQSFSAEITTGAEDDGLLFWIGMADAQYALKELSESVSYQGLNALEKLQHMGPISASDIAIRKQHYMAAPMPERKAVRKPKKYRCCWNIGDTFAYQLSGAEAEALGLSGHYMLFRKVDALEFEDGRLLPVVTLTHWKELPLPTNSSEFQQAPVLKLSRGRLGLPISQYEYRAELIIQNIRQVQDLPLEYLGNFPDIQTPDDEVIVRHSGEILMISPKYLTRDCCAYWRHHCYYVAQQDQPTKPAD